MIVEEMLTFDARGNKKQIEAARYWGDDYTFDIAYGGSKGSGKSFLGCSLILADALTYDETNYFIARKTLADLRKHTSASVAEVLKGWGIHRKTYKYNGMDNYYSFDNGSKVYFLDCKEMPSDPLYYRFGSVQMTRGMIEEAGEVDVKAKNALVATIGRWKNKEYNLPPKLLLTCNPSKNFLYQDYYEPHKQGKFNGRTRRKFIQALPTDNFCLDPRYLQNLEENLTYAERRRLLHGDWEYDEDPSILMDYDSILDIFREKSLPDGKRCMTVDIARMGGARVVCIVWNGYKGKVYSWARAELPETLRKVEELREKNNITRKDVLVDGDGIGPGVGDYGGYSQFRNNFPAYPSLIRKMQRDRNGNIVKENFDNRKSQCGFQMADKIVERSVYLQCAREEDKQLIIQELEQVRKKNIDSDLKNALIPKEGMAKILRRSPDFWDSILMRRGVDYLVRKGPSITPRDGNDNAPGQYGAHQRYNRYGA